MELGPFDEFDDEFGDDEEFFGPVPHADDRLWRHPSEVAAELAAASQPAPAGVSAAGAAASSTRLLTRSSPRLVLALAGVATMLVVAGGAQLFTNISEPTATIAIAAPIQRDAAITTAPAAPGTDGAITVAVAAPSATSELPWVDALRRRVEPSTPQVIAVSDSNTTEGYGLFIDPSGLVLTSASLVADAKTLVVRTTAGQRFHAIVIGQDLQSDLAILDIDGDNHPVADLTNTSRIRIGQHTLGMTRSNTTGMEIGRIVTLSGHSELPSGTMVYGTFGIDLPATELMPGSAVFNDTGAVVGMVAAAADTNSNVAVIPISLARRVGAELLAHGRVHRASLGVEVAEKDPPAELAPLGVDPERDVVVAITSLTVGGPSELAGLDVEDYIIRLDGQRVSSATDVIAALRDHSPGDMVTVEVARGGTRFITEVETALVAD